MKTKYQSIADEIRNQILSNFFQIGQTIPAEHQLQHDYQVSRDTIRKAVSVLVNEGFLRREKGSGTYVNEIHYQKTSTENKSPKTIGLITTYISDYIFPTIIRGIEQELNEKGYSLLLSSTNNNYAQEKKCLEKMIDFGVDGLIVEPTKSNQYNPNLATYVNLREHNIPIVMINAVYEELSTPFICVDDVQVGYIATKELVDNNHKNLLLITKLDDLQGKLRMKGFIKACEEGHIQISSDSIVTYTTETIETVYAEVINHLKTQNITGVVCYNDMVAKVLINRLTELGYNIPEDYSIVGNDNSNLSQMGGISLTSTEHPKVLMGIDAARWIVQTIEEGKPGKDILYQPNLIQRNSVRKLENT
ncbi:GntR family transcriptional regulator [Lactovum miscens]|uniref:GntR family transcriptional regulator of arabinose operon n=1 Tax=Lactovum miscens TaxID=190387 RepID=A0A841C6C7_9LACT|nr:GntR family transcriptional regulator [Lactovum miscens]MBB5887298.1 GntR family transcriptional regulator of arabinose operon [Lactovum miscens]